MHKKSTEHGKAPYDEILRRLDDLSPEQEERLRTQLNERAWQRCVDQIQLAELGRNAIETWQRLIERVESGDIDQDIRRASTKTWEDLVRSASMVGTAFSKGVQAAAESIQSPEEGKSESDDAEFQVEQAYQNLQSELSQVRQAVAQSIATEKQLEGQLQKNMDQAATWQDRAQMATQQGNDDLSKQALARKEQYSEAASTQRETLERQKNEVRDLRQRLTDLEGNVQKAYTSKQVLIARSKAARATIKANNIMSGLSTNNAKSVIDRMEQKVAALEAEAALKDDATTEFAPLDTDQLLIRALSSLKKATDTIERLESLIGPPGDTKPAPKDDDAS